MVSSRVDMGPGAMGNKGMGLEGMDSREGITIRGIKGAQRKGFARDCLGRWLVVAVWIS